MADQGYTRKLTAILGADVKGYGRMMDRDEEATLRTLTSHRTAFVDLIEKFRGRIVDTPGDYILAEFPSVVDSVDCAVEIQREIAERNEELPEERKMEFRIGINLGDVIEKDGKIYGDGVNIAARMEPLADAGGICITGRVYDQVANKLDLEYEYLGEHEVKNVSMPIRVYKVLSHPGAAAHRVVQAKRAASRQWRNKAFGATMVALVAIVSLVLWQVYEYSTINEPASVENMAFPLPDKPSIAVLPFENMSGDPEQEYFSDGFTEDLITSISKIPRIFVISRQSSFTYKDKPVNVKTVAEELGVHYVLEGSIQKEGDQIRINVQLIDALKGHHLWSERYDRKLENIFKLKDEIIFKVVTELAVELTDGERARALARYTDNLEAWQEHLRGNQIFVLHKKESNIHARELFTNAIRLDPRFLPSYYGLAWTHFFDARMGWTDSRKKSFDLAVEFANKALAIDDTYWGAYSMLCTIHLFKRDFEKAEEYFKKAGLHAPATTYFYAIRAFQLNYLGKPHEAISHFHEAMRLSPFYPAWYLYHLGLAFHLTGQYDEAIETLNKAVERTPNSIFPHPRLAMIYCDLGRMQEAQAEAAEVLRVHPTFTIEGWSKANPFRDPEIVAQREELLRQAGLPERPPRKLPDKPSIAVLPLENMSGDPEQEYFSDGITEDIITALSKTPQMFVIARSSTFTYKGKEVDVEQIAEEMGVQYVLKGSVRKEADRVRITAQLIDALTGQHLWAEKYDRRLEEIFSLQDEITKRIISSLQVELTEGEQAKVYAKGTDNLEAYLKAMKAHFLYLNGSRDGLLNALELAREAIDLDPNYAFAYKVLGGAKGVTLWRGLSENPKETLQETIALHQKSVELDDSLAIAHAGLGYWIMYTREHDKAVAEGERAYILEPGSADVLHLYATILAYSGRREESIPLFEEALRLNPKPPNSYLRHYSMALRDTGRYQEGIALMERAIRNEPDDIIAWVQIACLSSLAGREDDIQPAVAEVLRINPNFSVARIERVTPHRDRTFAERFGDCMRRTGLPE